MDLFDLTQKTIIITGGCGLIGQSFTEALLAYGASVVIGDINAERGYSMIERLSTKYDKHKLCFQYLDITCIQSVRHCVQHAVQRFGKIDVLINNAYPRNKNYGTRYEDINFDDWRENVDWHLNGYFLMAHETSKQMIKQNRGHIINISSIYGMRGPRFDIYEGTSMTMPAEYAAIKGGIISLTRYLATYLGNYNITANCISFGGIFDNQPQDFVKRYEKNVPLGRMATVDDVKGIIVFLASDASNYIMGQNIVVDGGWTAH